MKTIIISEKGACVEFTTKKGATPDTILSINAHTQIVVIAQGEPAKVQVIAFESCDVGERIANGEKVLFLRGNTLLATYPHNKKAAGLVALIDLGEFFTGALVPEIHKPVCDKGE